MALSVCEAALWLMGGLLFWRKNLQKQFPSMGIYLSLHCLAVPLMLFLYYAQNKHMFNNYAFSFYFFSYWSLYIVSALLLYQICTELFRSALTSFPGLQNLGIVIFRWVLIASVTVSITTFSFTYRLASLLPDITVAFMRTVSVLELCLLAFLALCMNKLNLSPRSYTFGIAFGFGLLSVSDLVFAAACTFHRLYTLTSTVQFITETVNLIGIGVWVAYFALPEPTEHPVLIAANSTIYRWEAIASALGHTGTKVVVQQPVGSFFLNDVEQVVEKVISRNLKNSESQS